MFGQGSPSSFAAALARVALVVCAIAVRSAVGQGSATPPPIEPVRLCISWSGGDSNPWVGRVRLDQGSLSHLRLLGLNPDAAGSIWIENSQVRIASLSPRKTDSIEVTADAAPGSSLLVELATGPKALPSQVRVPLADLVRHPYQLRLDDHGNTLDVRVVPTPSLQISFLGGAAHNNALIFAPGEQLAFELAPALPATLHGTTLDIQTTLSPARRKEVVWSDNQKLAVPVDGQPRIDLTVPLQVAEGVYTVHISVSRASGYFRDKFFPGAATPIAERSFQIVVVGARPAASEEVGRWKKVLEIDPTNPRWVERLPSWTQFQRIPGLNHGPLGSIRAGAADLPLGRFVELPSTVKGADPHWQAYSLPLEAVGAPHLLEIDYPADEEQHFGLSIVEPNAAGVVEGVQHDAGVYVEGLGRKEEKHEQTQRLIFWPRTQAPLLVVTNEHPTAAAHFGQIRVMKRIGPLTSRIPVTSHDRLIAAYLARPLARTSFGATEALESIVNSGAPKSVDDYQTLYQSATRLADYVQAGGFNSAIVSVLADGSSIFPNSHLQLTPRYDSGRLTERPRETDGLELMLRVFDREGLTLIPAIEFATPIPKLEELRRNSDPHISGLELVGSDGRTWLEVNGTRGGLAPYYNVLDPRVQQAMLDIVQEIVARYGTHPSFGGLSVQLKGDGYTQLSTLEWGLDDSTVDRFAHDTGTQLRATGPERFAARTAALTGPNAVAWRSWRAKQIAAFYSRMAVLVHGDGQRKLVLTTEKLFDNPQIGQRIRPNLLADNRVSETMLELGIDRQLLERTPSVVLCPTRYVESMSPLPDHAIDLELNAAFTHWNHEPTASTKSAALLFRRALPFRLTSFEPASPFRIGDEMRLVSQPMPGGTAARQAYLQAMMRNSPAVLIDGGDFLPLGQDDVLRSVRKLLATLPTTAQISEIVKQPVIVRTYSENNQAIIVVMNTAPWRVDAEIALDTPQPTTLEPVLTGTDPDRVKPRALLTGRQPWNVSLEPYDLKAVRIGAAGIKVEEVHVTLDDTANSELKHRLDNLANRNLSAPHAYRALANPNFEPVGGAGAVPGWHLVGNPSTATAVLDAISPQDGKTCLYLRNNGQLAALESDPFPIPATGQLSMTVFARSQSTAPGTELRLVFEGESEGQAFRRATEGVDPKHENQQWSPYAILVSDLPLDSRGEMRIKFEVTGPGEFWLDNVNLNDILLPLKYYNNASAEIVKLLQRTHDVQAAYDGGQLNDCIQLLDGYWPRFVMAYTPPSAPAVALTPAAAKQPPPVAPAQSTPPADEDEQTAPSLGERIKRMVPLFR